MKKKFENLKRSAKTVGYLYKSVFNNQDGSLLEKFSKTNKIVGEVTYRSYVKPKITQFEEWLNRKK